MLPLTRKEIETLSSYEIETRMELMQKDHFPPGVLAIYDTYQSVLFERLHHEAQLHAIKYAKVFAKRLARRWLRRYGLNERTV